MNFLGSSSLIVELNIETDVLKVKDGRALHVRTLCHVLPIWNRKVNVNY